jgi:tetratricopeptide (TPR) repeat protein
MAVSQALVAVEDLEDPEIEGVDGSAILDEATELEEEGFYEEAIEAYMEALAMGLDPARCHHGAARCYEELSDAEEAARECTECLAANPNDVVALTTRGWQYLALSMLMEAKADATAAIALAPSDVEVLDLNEEVQYELSDSTGGAAFDEAQRLYTQGKFGDAIGFFSQALEQRYADVFSAYNVRGLCKVSALIPHPSSLIPHPSTLSGDFRRHVDCVADVWRLYCSTI